MSYIGLQFCAALLYFGYINCCKEMEKVHVPECNVDINIISNHKCMIQYVNSWAQSCGNNAWIMELLHHYIEVIMGTMVSKITSVSMVCSTAHPGINQRKYKSSVSLVFVRGIHWRPVNPSHKGPVTRKMFPFDDVIMILVLSHQCVIVFKMLLRECWEQDLNVFHHGKFQIFHWFCLFISVVLFTLSIHIFTVSWSYNICY